MPLPLPLLGSALALVTGAVLLRQRDGDNDDSTTDARRHLMIRLRNARLSLRGTLRALGHRRLEIWEDVLLEFVRIRQRIDNLPHDGPALRFPGLAGLTEADLIRMARCGEVVSAHDAALLREATPTTSLAPEDIWSAAPAPAERRSAPREEWQDVLPTASLLAAGALGKTPLDPLDPSQHGSPTIDWLADEALQPVAEPVLGGIVLGEAAQATLRGEAGSPAGDRELRALLAALETTQLVAAHLDEVTRSLDRAARPRLSELWMLVQINGDYDSMSDLPLPTMARAPRRVVEHAHHLAAVLLRLCEVPLLHPDGALRVDLQATLDIADAAADRYT